LLKCINYKSDDRKHVLCATGFKAKFDHVDKLEALEIHTSHMIQYRVSI